MRKYGDEMRVRLPPIAGGIIRFGAAYALPDHDQYGRIKEDAKDAEPGASRPDAEGR